MMGAKASLKISKNGSKNPIFTPASLQFRGLGPDDIDTRQPTDARPRISGAAQARIGQDRRQQPRLPRRQHGSAMAKGIEAAGLHAELTAGPELGDIEIDFQNSRLGQ